MYIKQQTKKAFTLIELLIVIAIIGILFIVLVSRVDFATDKAKATGVQTDFRSFQVAFDQVAKENAGFNIFGWDTGDTNGDHIRNSYDQGDTNKNGKEDAGETFIGRKEYGENWTTIYTMLNPDTTKTDDISAFVALERAINANLDPKLHITITPDIDGGVLTGNATITMANQARDPWKNEYHGVFITNADEDGADRGAIIIYSNGANGEWGSAHDIANGVVTVSVPGNNVAGQDDMSIVSCYTYVNGYGEVKNSTAGFSTNQGFLNGGSNIDLGTNTTPDTPNVPEVPSEPETPSEPQPSDPVLVNNKAYTSFVPSFATTLCLIVRNDGTIAIVDVNNGGVASFSYNLDDNNSFSIYSEDFGTLHFDATSNTSIHCREMDIVLTVDDTNVVCENDYVYVWQSQLGGFEVSALSNTSYMSQIKSSINGRPVVSIAENAFGHCNNIVSLSIPEGITHIGQFAFEDCTSLQTITLPSSLTNIDEWAFSGCSALQSISLPDNITSIESGTFAGCTGIKSIYIGQNVSYIASGALYSLIDLESLIVSPDNITFRSVNNCLIDINAKTIIKGCFNSVIPDDGSVTTIGHMSFTEIDKLIDLVIPDSIIHLEYGAFSHCSNLESIHFGKDVQSWDIAAFSFCPSIKTLTVDPENTTYYSINNCVVRYSNKWIVLGGIDSVIPDDGSVTGIGMSAFRNLNITSIVIPEGISVIDLYAFEGCEQLVEVTLPASLTALQYSSFSYNENLIVINFAGTVEQWNRVGKDNWHSSVPATYVQCSDGMVELQ